MKVLSYGSLNIDYVYAVDHFVAEGETLSSMRRMVFSGGKGLNQSIAMARAGLAVQHAGAVGMDDSEILLTELERSGVDTARVRKLPVASGHAIIQRTADGKNCILLYGGANQEMSREQIARDLADFAAGDMLLLQNEINELPFLVDRAFERGMRIVLNPSPMNARILEIDLRKISVFILNEVEAEQIIEALPATTGAEANGLANESADLAVAGEDERRLRRLAAHFPEALLLLTLGAEGSMLYRNGMPELLRQKAIPTKVRDTTAAGDTFSGYFLAALAQGKTLSTCLHEAALASSIAVSREGAAPSIPHREELDLNSV